MHIERLKGIVILVLMEEREKIMLPNIEHCSEPSHEASRRASVSNLRLQSLFPCSQTEYSVSVIERLDHVLIEHKLQHLQHRCS